MEEEVKVPIHHDDIIKKEPAKEIDSAAPEGFIKKYSKIIEAAIAVVIILVVVGYYFVFYKGGQPNNSIQQINNPSATTSTNSTTNQTPKENFVITEIASTTKENSQKGTITSNPSKLAAPINFKSFSYDSSAGKIISISGSCSDKYYALLVFNAQDDYRKNPAAAKYNSAFECPSNGKFTLNVNMKDFNLPSGTYYLFVADQGNTGTWYNPR